MGIDGLHKWTRAKHPGCIQVWPMSAFNGHVLAFDISNDLHRHKHARITHSRASLCIMLYRLVVKYVVRYGIVPMVVFDGEATDSKRAELESRARIREDAKLQGEGLVTQLRAVELAIAISGGKETIFATGEQLPSYEEAREELHLLELAAKTPNSTPTSSSSAGDVSPHSLAYTPCLLLREIDRLCDESRSLDDLMEMRSTLQDKLGGRQAQSMEITKRDKEACKQMMVMLGVPFVPSPHEADDMLAKLYHNGIISGVVAADGDMLAHGIDILITKEKNDMAHVTFLPQLLQSSHMTFEQFTNVCALAGSDATRGDRAHIMGMGIAKAHELILKCGYIENILALPKYEDALPPAKRQALVAERDHFLVAATSAAKNNKTEKQLQHEAIHGTSAMQQWHPRSPGPQAAAVLEKYVRWSPASSPGTILAWLEDLTREDREMEEEMARMEKRRPRDINAPASSEFPKDRALQYCISRLATLLTQAGQ